MEAAPLDLKAEFTSIGFAKNCALGLKISNDEMDDEQARHFFAGTRIQVEMTMDPNGQGDVDGQQKMIDETVRVNTVADCRSIRLGVKDYGCRLSINKNEVHPDDIAKFSNASGRIKVTRIGTSQSSEDDPEDGGDDSNED